MAKGLSLLRGGLVALLAAPFVVVMSPVVAAQALPGAAVACDVTYVLEEAPAAAGGTVSIFTLDRTASTLTTHTAFTPIRAVDGYSDAFEGLAVDPVRNLFWAVNWSNIGHPAEIQQISPADNSIRAFSGESPRTPAVWNSPNDSFRFGGLDLTSNIYYYGYVEGSRLHVYGFRVDTETPIRGEIATIELTVTPASGRFMGDITFDSNGNLYLVADGLVAKTTRLPVVGSPTPPTITATRLFVYNSTNQHFMDGISFSPDGLINLAASNGLGASFNYVFDESLGYLTALDTLTPTGRRTADSASCLSTTVPGSFPVPPVVPLPASPVINSGWDFFPDDPGDSGSSVYGEELPFSEPRRGDLFGYFPDGNRAVIKSSGAIANAETYVFARDMQPGTVSNGVWTVDDWLTPTARLYHYGERCPVSGLCDGPANGSFTIEFDQPVENLFLHFTGLSAQEGIGPVGNTQHVSTMSEVLTTDREVQIASSNPKSLQVTPGPNGTYVVGIPAGITSLSCTDLVSSGTIVPPVTATQFAGCGTLAVPGTVKSITFSANLMRTVARGNGFVIAGSGNEFGLALSYDRLAVDAPVPTPTPALPGLPAPPVKQSVPSVPAATAALAATGSSLPVWWAAAAVGLWLTGTVLVRRRRAARSSLR